MTAASSAPIVFEPCSLTSGVDAVTGATAAGDGASAGARPSGGPGGAGGAESDPWAADTPGSYSDDPPF